MAEPKLYACNRGAAGIDRWCAYHLVQVFAHPDNIDAEIDAEDYVPVAAYEDLAVGEGKELCDGDSENACRDLSATDVLHLIANLAAFRNILRREEREREERDRNG